MRDHFSLPQWNSLAGADDHTLPLLGTALLIARDEYPQLDADLYDTLLQSHAESLRGEIEAIDSWPLKMAAINKHLFDELGYSGNSDAYYDPRNSYLNEVFERRLGNPISLAMVQIEVARRLGVPLDGVSFPGHFLVRLPVDDGVLVMDPFNRGRPLGADELRERAKPHLGGEIPDDTALLQILNPASHRSILIRMLRNLQGVYAEADDWERAARSSDRVLKLSPDQPEALRDRGLAYLKLGHRQGARHDLARYLQLNPDAEDRASLRERLVELHGSSERPN
ncbi:MAG: SirB1 family protein [Lysobacter sp.]|nr:SirB1 family protein [Lysobacter sp.]